MSADAAIACDLFLGEDDVALAITWPGPAPIGASLRLDSLGLWLMPRRGAPILLGAALTAADRAALSAHRSIAVAFVASEDDEPQLDELPLQCA